MDSGSTACQSLVTKTNENQEKENPNGNEKLDTTERNLIEKYDEVCVEQKTNADSAVEIPDTMNKIVENNVSLDNIKDVVPSSSSESKTDNKINEIQNSMIPPIKINSISSLGLISQYASSSDEESDGDGENMCECSTDGADDVSSLANNIVDTAISKGNYRCHDSDTSDIDSNDSEVEDTTNDGLQTIDITKEDEFQNFLEQCESKQSKEPVIAKDELLIDDLPPIAELSISVPESECVELGTIYSIVDKLVLVESLPNFAALDIDTVLFLMKGNQTLGQIFDVMGNISSPIYCVRFNSAQDIKNKNLSIGMKVYVAPQTEYTSFIVLSDLMKQKGCDASWENDHEVPNECNEYSDDEEERLARRNRTLAQRKALRSSNTEPHLPEKVEIRSESFCPTNQSQQKKWTRKDRSSNDKYKTKNSPRFYRDNRGYNNSFVNQNQQQMPHTRYDHSWHTSGSMPQNNSMGYMPNIAQNTPQQSYSNFYPNPFAMQMNFPSYSQQQAFPPLPPPLPHPTMRPQRKS